MSEYRASEEDMRTYTEIVHQLAILDIQRSQVIQSLKEWEQAHIIEAPKDDPEAPEEETPTQ